MPNLTCLFGHDYRNEGGNDRIIYVCFKCGKFKPDQIRNGETSIMASDLIEAVAEVQAASENNDETSAAVASVKEFLETMAQGLASLYGSDSSHVQTAQEAVMRCDAVLTQIFIVGSEIDDLSTHLSAMTE